VDLLMGSDIIVAELQTKHTSSTRSQSVDFHKNGVMIGPFQADVYSVQGVVLRPANGGSTWPRGFKEE
jgi:hypothetical protein